MATTINSYSVGFGMDARSYIDGAKISRSETRALIKDINEAKEPLERYAEAQDRIAKAYESGAISIQTANRLLDSAAEKHGLNSAAAENLARAEKELSQLRSRGESVTRSVMSAEERYSETVKELNSLLAKGHISTTTYSRAKIEAKKTLDTATGATARLAEEERKKQQTIQRGNQIIQQYLTPHQKLTHSQNELNRLVKSGAIDQNTYNRAMVDAKRKYTEASLAANSHSKSVSSLTSSIKTMVGAYVGMQTITQSVRLFGQVEDARVAFETLTGSVNDGKVLFEQIRSFAEKSPITFANATQASKTMMSFGIHVQDVQENLRMLSDITGGNNERFKSLSLAFSQMSAAGRLMGQDLLQMINAGFNPLQQISKTTGESLIDLKKRMEDGAVSAEEVRNAFISATSEGGMFNGMTERLAGTVGGKLNIALSQLEQAGAKLGETLSPMILALLDGFEKNNSVLQDGISLVQKFADGVGFLFALGKDAKSGISYLFGSPAEIDAVSKFLDSLDERDRQAEMDSMAQKQKLNFEKEKEAAEKLDETINEKEKKRLEKEQKEKEKLLNQEEKARDKMARDAIAAARKEFDERDKRQKQMQAEIAKGPDGGFEAGSAEAARFLADQANSAIGEAAMPEAPTPGETELLAEARKQLELAQAQTTKMDDQINLLRQLVNQPKIELAKAR